MIRAKVRGPAIELDGARFGFPCFANLALAPRGRQPRRPSPSSGSISNRLHGGGTERVLLAQTDNFSFQLRSVYRQGWGNV